MLKYQLSDITIEEDEIGSVGIMATVPTQILTNEISCGMAAASAGIVVAFTIGTQWLWKFGLSHYKSASC